MDLTNIITKSSEGGAKLNATVNVLIDGRVFSIRAVATHYESYGQVTIDIVPDEAEMVALVNEKVSIALALAARKIVGLN